MSPQRQHGVLSDILHSRRSIGGGEGSTPSTPSSPRPFSPPRTPLASSFDLIRFNSSGRSTAAAPSLNDHPTLTNNDQPDVLHSPVPGAGVPLKDPLPHQPPVATHHHVTASPALSPPMLQVTPATTMPGRILKEGRVRMAFKAADARSLKPWPRLLATLDDKGYLRIEGKSLVKLLRAPSTSVPSRDVPSDVVQVFSDRETGGCGDGDVAAGEDSDACETPTPAAASVSSPPRDLVRPSFSFRRSVDVSTPRQSFTVQRGGADGTPGGPAKLGAGGYFYNASPGSGAGAHAAAALSPARSSRSRSRLALFRPSRDSSLTARNPGSIDLAATTAPVPAVGAFSPNKARRSLSRGRGAAGEGGLRLLGKARSGSGGMPPCLLFRVTGVEDAPCSGGNAGAAAGAGKTASGTYCLRISVAGRVEPILLRHRLKAKVEVWRSALQASLAGSELTALAEETAAAGRHRAAEEARLREAVSRLEQQAAEADEGERQREAAVEKMRAGLEDEVAELRRAKEEAEKGREKAERERAEAWREGEAMREEIKDLKAKMNRMFTFEEVQERIEEACAEKEADIGERSGQSKMEESKYKVMYERAMADLAHQQLLSAKAIEGLEERLRNETLAHRALQRQVELHRQEAEPAVGEYKTLLLRHEELWKKHKKLSTAYQLLQAAHDKEAMAHKRLAKVLRNHAIPATEGLSLQDDLEIHSPLYDGQLEFRRMTGIGTNAPPNSYHHPTSFHHHHQSYPHPAPYAHPNLHISTSRSFTTPYPISSSPPNVGTNTPNSPRSTVRPDSVMRHHRRASPSSGEHNSNDDPDAESSAGVDRFESFDSVHASSASPVADAPPGTTPPRMARGSRPGSAAGMNGGWGDIPSPPSSVVNPYASRPGSRIEAHPFGGMVGYVPDVCRCHGCEEQQMYRHSHMHHQPPNVGYQQQHISHHHQAQHHQPAARSRRGSASGSGGSGGAVSPNTNGVGHRPSLSTLNSGISLDAADSEAVALVRSQAARWNPNQGSDGHGEEGRGQEGQKEKEEKVAAMLRNSTSDASLGASTMFGTGSSTGQMLPAATGEAAERTGAPGAGVGGSKAVGMGSVFQLFGQSGDIRDA
ncbi:hypothetical protein HDU96_009954 [Phlyctochytrium bullatum]|nr:hypothetical protein HDU96_009954 [Phlyctochytrium bullatum]